MFLMFMYVSVYDMYDVCMHVCMYVFLRKQYMNVCTYT